MPLLLTKFMEKTYQLLTYEKNLLLMHMAKNRCTSPSRTCCLRTAKGGNRYIFVTRPYRYSYHKEKPICHMLPHLEDSGHLYVHFSLYHKPNYYICLVT